MGAQFWPLLDVLGYEFATLVSLLITTLGGIRAVHAARAMRQPTDLWSTWWRIQGDLVSLATLSAVVSLHQVDLAQRYADRIIGLSHGRVIFDAAPQTLDQASYDTLYEQVPRSSLSVPQDAREERLIDTSFPMQLATVKD